MHFGERLVRRVDRGDARRKHRADDIDLV